jgi:agmatine deiminase
MTEITKKPSELGFRFPAEWEPHSATWLSWPRPDGISFPGSYHRVVPTLVKMVAALVGAEQVCINVGSERQEEEVRGYLSEVDSTHLRFARIPTNEPWCRDHGPIFVTRKEDPKVLVLDWGYNAWGGKYPPFDFDDDVPTKVASLLNLPVVYPGLVMEGGSLDGNGEGTLLTTESCLLNPNRNPGVAKGTIEETLKNYLGVKQILWLGEGIDGDDTDGHVDDLTRFVSRSTVVTVVESDPTDVNYEPLQENLRRLNEMKLWDGTSLTVVELPMPAAIEREGLRLPASYANFYIGNEVILLPTYADKNDAEATETLQCLFPMRKVIGIDCRELIWGLGAFHCLTQQQPRV